jgi:hypothetical protein
MKKKTTEPSAVTPAPVDPSWINRATTAWTRFWFTPADPTVLALIRICSGMVIFYTFVAYTWDLQALLGKDAWMNLEVRQRMYRESPQVKPELPWMEIRLHRPDQAGPHQDYWDRYVNKYKVPPPYPWPANAAEERRIDEYIARWSVDPRLLRGEGQPAWSIWFHITDPTAMMAVQLATVVVCFMFLIGFCTRITTPLTWAASLSYIHRAAASVFGVDTMMVILLLYLSIAPCGAVLSVDSLLARWWARARPRVLARWHALWGRQPAVPSGDLPAEVLPARPVPSVSANIALRLLQIHVCIIYASAGLSKLQGTAWWNGTAVWGTMANFEYAPMQEGWYLGFMRFLGRYHWLTEVCMTTAGLFTLFFEIAYPFLIWKPSTRWLMLWMAIILHGFIGLFMGLKTFSLIMLAMNMAFVPPETVRWMLRLLTRGRYGQEKPAPAPVVEGEKAEKAGATRQERESRQVAGAEGITRART